MSERRHIELLNLGAELQGPIWVVYLNTSALFEFVLLHLYSIKNNSIGELFKIYIRHAKIVQRFLVLLTHFPHC